MKTYRVSYEVSRWRTVEANSPQEAEQIAMDVESDDWQDDEMTSPMTAFEV